MGKITIEKVIRKVDEFFGAYVFILIFFLSGVGFFLGVYSTSLWYIENFGEPPHFLFVILKIFGILMRMGVAFALTKIFLWVLQFSKKRGKK